MQDLSSEKGIDLISTIDLADNHSNNPEPELGHCLIDTEAIKKVSATKEGDTLFNHYVSIYATLDETQQLILSKGKLLQVVGDCASIDQFAEGLMEFLSLNEILLRHDGAPSSKVDSDDSSKHSSLYRELDSHSWILMAFLPSKLLKVGKMWYTNIPKQTTGGEKMVDMEHHEAGQQETENAPNLKQQPISRPDLKPSAAIEELNKAIDDLNVEQAPYREKIAALLKSLEGNSDFSDKERRLFVHTFNELIDRLGVAVFFPGCEEPIRLSLRDYQGKTYFRYIQDGQRKGSKTSLWRAEIRPKPTNKFRKI